MQVSCYESLHSCYVDTEQIQNTIVHNISHTLIRLK